MSGQQCLPALSGEKQQRNYVLTSTFSLFVLFSTRCSRTGEALKQLSALRADLSAPRTRLIADLASLDPAAAGKLEAMMTSAAAASAAGDADAKARLVGEIAAIDPSAHYADDVERVAAAEAIFNALVGHAKAAPSIAAPAAAAGQAAAAKQAQA